MARINEIKEQQGVVKTVGDFAGSLQQIAASRMVKLRDSVTASRRFVEEATLILRELQLEKNKQIERELKLEGKLPLPAPAVKRDPNSTAIIVVSSNQGLCGSYNSEIFKKVDEIVPDFTEADYFVIGAKGQAYFERLQRKYNLSAYPYNIPEEVQIIDLKPLIGIFFYYQAIYLIYSKYINTARREVVFVELAVPNIEEVEIRKETGEGKFIFEPDVFQLIDAISAQIRYALFRQQVLDSKLSLYTAQMMAMKTASDNAVDLMAELRLEYNKARRKLVDKKIQEVQAGRLLWSGEE